MNRTDAKVDIVIPTGGKGGVEKVVNTVANYLMHYGMKIRIIQMIKGDIDWHDEGIPYFSIYESTKGQSTDTFIQGYASFIAAEGMPDIVLATNWPLMTMVCKQACKNVCQNGCNNKPVRVVSWVHNQIGRYEADHRGGLDSLDYADAHLAICKDIYDEIENTLHKNNAYLVYNPVEHPKIELKQPNDTNTLLYVGRIHEVKRVDFILMILAVCKNWKLKIIGSGEKKLVDGLKELANQIQVSERVEWIEWMEHPWEAAKEATALIMASEFEGFPMVALEASSVGLPVISTPVSGVNEYIENGKNGYLYHAGNLAEVAGYLLDIEEKLVVLPDPAQCRKLAEPFWKETVCENIRSILMDLWTKTSA